MTAVALLSGITASESAEFRTQYPVNMEPIAIDNRIAKGQLRHAMGATLFGSGPGIDRGGINWNDQCYRVMGSKLVRVSAQGSVSVLGDVGTDGKPVALDYSFDRLGIASAGKLFYWDGMNVTQVTDTDLGTVLDYIWFDSYHMTTDGNYIIVTELSDPYSVKPLKYGSAEEDPDMITGLFKFREELYALGRYTIQVFGDVGGSGFPFANKTGAGIPYGCVGPYAKARFATSFAFVGSRRNEPLGVYLAASGDAAKISTRTIDDALATVQDETSIIVEVRSSRDEERLYLHLPDTSWVYLHKASSTVQDYVWYQVFSGNDEPYRPRFAVTCYGQLICGDLISSNLGLLTPDVASHFGEPCNWQFDCGLLYNQAKGGIIDTLELVGLPGRSDNSTVSLSYTKDGENFSVERYISSGRRGERAKRVQWRPHVLFRNWIGLRFKGTGVAGWASLEAGVRGMTA